MQLYGVAPYPMYACCLPYAWVGLEPHLETKCFVSFSFDFIRGAHKSKRGICRHLIVYPLQLGPLFPNDGSSLRPKVGFWPNLMKIDLRKCLWKI